ncbi:miniconductance mechanosensitive channel MscM [Candidatus Palibaumannia cicadellinicola]|uniref:Potassium efflux system KefA protein / Small-conductance mechanosensitive channel n=1 Tax=Candidatus Palibaumannia cicadellinicola TaxID=186490 RepID=A0A0K2BLQ1_9GAMM|nr:miniconductance mechanosensitive channel MscM [Candidatus Baumannia cicadellinicola]AKZ66114.1 Potassium efflux system KefA protein / Small-conductance mechanosensitive channel [Candidatus Baumannia cicadellinicola]
MHFIIIFLLGLLVTTQGLNANIHNDHGIKKNLIQKELDDKSTANHHAIIYSIQLALNAVAESKASILKIKEYQKVIEDFQFLKLKISAKQQKIVANQTKIKLYKNSSTIELNKQLLQLNRQFMDITRQLQHEQEITRTISDSLSFLPQQQTKARKALNDIEQQLQQHLLIQCTPLEQSQATALQAEQIALRLKVYELDLTQLSANKRQELSRLRAEILKQRQYSMDTQLQLLRNYLNILYQNEAEQAFKHNEMIAEQGITLPKSISNLLKTNRKFYIALNKQAKRMDIIASQQRNAVLKTQKIRKVLTNLIEHEQWLNESPILGETLRNQISNLTDFTNKKPKPLPLDREIAQRRVKRLQYEDLINKLPHLITSTQDDGSPLKPAQKLILSAQLITQRNLLNALLTGSDTEILELTKLKVSFNQLEDAIRELNESAHSYLFWVADVTPVNFAYPLLIFKDIKQLINLDTYHQFICSIKMMCSKNTTFIPLVGSIILIVLSISSRKTYYKFLVTSSNKVGKVNQDHFILTLRTVLWSLLIALPLPLFWATIGYGLRHAWPYPAAVAFGEGISATVLILWILIVSTYFANNQGLFIVHFGWPALQVKRAQRYYTFFISMIIPLIIILIALDTYHHREFASNLGRLCFILLCICLALVKVNLKKAGLPLHLDKHKHSSSENMVNRLLWNIIISAPIFAAIASCLGHLATAQSLLAKLEKSVAIWLLLLIIYYIIRRWMFIQRRRIAFERAKQRRAEILAQRARNDDNLSQSQLNEVAAEVDDKVLDLDTMSTQSLQLVRSIITLIALISIILLWSDIYSAFSFLEKIQLWDVTYPINGVETIHPITLGAVLVAIIVSMITTQLVRNLPALLELALLQHLNLTPGTGYAITTLTKYSLMFLGGLIAFSFIGIDWSKLQWLVAALGVGLGFGLQEIFANFISGLIILFEKPIRIGDTVTISNLTGNITRINTRATTITDWDRKEIIMPNKSFITEQFVNWSLSDTVTRVVLHIPAPPRAHIEQITHILVQAAQNCQLVLEMPVPEAFLVNVQHGVPIFELRMYVAEMGHRMPLRHQVHMHIINGYRENDIELPLTPMIQWFQSKFNINEAAY